MAFPEVQLIPQPDDRVDFVVNGKTRLTYHHGATIPRPFLYPLIGPAGQSVTRLGHPHDPMGHRHHRGIWTGHHDVNGQAFWAEAAGNRIVFRKLVELSDGDVGRLVAEHDWVDHAGRTHLRERWSVTYHDLPKDEGLVELVLEYEPVDKRVEFGKTPFGFFGLRVAKTMSVQDGDGKVINDHKAVNEPAVHWKPARWVDYSGAVGPGVVNGVAVMGAEENPRHPNYYHVRNDGWIGHSFCYGEGLRLELGETLRLRLGVYVHDGPTDHEAIEKIREWWTGH